MAYPAPTVTVSTQSELLSAVAAAGPGTVIFCNPGSYGTVSITANGAAGNPIWIYGTWDVVFTTGTINSNHCLTIDNSSYLVVANITATTGQKGITVKFSDHITVQDCHVHNLGHEAIHLKQFTTDSIVQNNEIHDAGLIFATYGEGVYLGSSDTNWDTLTGGLPDTSDRNQVLNNNIYATTAQSIEAKQGTSDGRIEGNVMDGVGCTASALVTVKGNGYIVASNTGTNAPENGMEVNGSVADWSYDNVFINNVIDVNSTGYGFKLYEPGAPTGGGQGTYGTVLHCSNVITNAALGFASYSRACVPDSNSMLPSLTQVAAAEGSAGASSTLPAPTQAAAGTFAGGGTPVAITYEGTATPVYAAFTLNINHPASIAAGDYLVILIGQKDDTATSETPAGWTLLGSAAGGGGTTGIDTGPTRVVAYGKIAAGGETGTQAVSLGSTNIAWGQMYRFSKSEGEWGIFAGGGVDSTAGAAWSVAVTAANGDVAASDYLLVGSALGTDTGNAPIWSGQGVSATGLTMGTAVAIDEPETFTNNDISGFIFGQPVSAGSNTSNLTVSATHGGTTTNVYGPSIVVRLRAVSTGVSGAAASALAALTQSATGSRTSVTFSGPATTAAPAISASAAGTHTAPVFSGTMASGLPSLTTAVAGTTTPPSNPGAAASQLPTLSQAVSGLHTPPTLTGTATNTMPSLTQSAEGTHTAPLFSGTASSGLPSLAQSAAGSHAVPVFSGTAHPELPAIVQSGTGSSLPPVYSGPGASVVLAFSQSAEGTHNAPGTPGAVQSELPSLTQAAVGSRTVPAWTGVAASTLPSLSQAIVGGLNSSGTAASTLPNATTSSAGVITVPVFEGAASSDPLPALVTEATGKLSSSGAGAITLPPLSAELVGVFIDQFAITPAVPRNRTLVGNSPVHTLEGVD